MRRRRRRLYHQDNKARRGLPGPLVTLLNELTLLAMAVPTILAVQFLVVTYFRQRANLRYYEDHIYSKDDDDEPPRKFTPMPRRACRAGHARTFARGATR